jgi:hypothetical protein
VVSRRAPVGEHELGVEDLIFSYEETQYVYRKRRVEGLGGDLTPYIRVEYSFDSETWHETLLDAFRVAQQTHTLRTAQDRGDSDDEFQVFVIKLLQELQKLDTGEALEVIKTERVFLVTKKAVVVAVNVGALKDIEVKPTEEGRRGR